MTALSPAQYLASLPPEVRKKLIGKLSPEARLKLRYKWSFLARQNQRLPPGDWDVAHWECGRGGGKTRAGAEAVREWEAQGVHRMALVARTKGDVRKTMLEGDSGLLNIYPPGEAPRYFENREQVEWKSGAIAQVFTDEKPDGLRGPQFEKAWCDEVAAWPRLRRTWDMLSFGMRLGDHPQIVVTTTPKRRRAYKEIFHTAGGPLKIVRLGGSSYENIAHLSEFYRRTLEKYAGTRLGRQEIDGVFLDALEGALWVEADLDRHRVDLLHMDHGELSDIVVGVDPAVTSKETSDETGIIVAGRTRNGHGVVLADYSMRAPPEVWMAAVVQAFHRFRADRVVAEVNNGGDLIEAMLKTFDSTIPYRAVHATRGKRIRAEPISSLYKQGKVHHVKAIDFGDGIVVPTKLEDLEDQMLSWDVDHGSDEPADDMGGSDVASPDRVDACIWSLADLFGSELHAWEAMAEW